jgi:hypothetical protein
MEFQRPPKNGKFQNGITRLLQIKWDTTYSNHRKFQNGNTRYFEMNYH